MMRESWIARFTIVSYAMNRATLSASVTQLTLPEARKANLAMVDLLGTVARRKNATSAQIALAWLLAQKPWIVPIPGTTKLHRLQENVGAAAVELDVDDLREIDSTTSQMQMAGARYSESSQRMIDR